MHLVVRIKIGWCNCSLWFVVENCSSESGQLQLVVLIDENTSRLHKLINTGLHKVFDRSILRSS
jgi:hypothetical protein